MHKQLAVGTVFGSLAAGSFEGRAIDTGMTLRSFAEYVAWREGLFYTDQPVKSSVAPNATINPKATPPKDGQLKPVKLAKPKVPKVRHVKVPQLKVGQKLPLATAHFPH